MSNSSNLIPMILQVTYYYGHDFKFHIPYLSQFPDKVWYFSNFLHSFMFTLSIAGIVTSAIGSVFVIHEYQIWFSCLDWVVGLSIEISKYFVIIAFQENFWFVLIPFVYMIILQDVCTVFGVWLSPPRRIFCSVFHGPAHWFFTFFSLSDSVSRFSYPLHRISPWVFLLSASEKSL